MILWLDNQLPPALASWMRATCDVWCVPIRNLDLQRASDIDIFLAARVAGAVVVTKAADFAALVGRHGSPPQVVLITCGNTSNARLRWWNSASIRGPSGAASAPGAVFGVAVVGVDLDRALEEERLVQAVELLLDGLCCSLGGRDLLANGRLPCLSRVAGVSGTTRKLARRILRESPGV